MPIKRKQNTSEREWRETLENIGQIVSHAQIDDLMARTVNDIQQKTRGKRAAYSWSGGKDSIALQKVCELAGVKDCVFVYCDLEYQAFMDWVVKHKPTNCEMINTHQDMNWLAKHPKMLFPQDSDTAGRWFEIVQHTGQEQYYRRHGLDIIILGRRLADGNFVGRGDNIYTNAQGITRYSPLAAWSHEDVLACIHYYGLPLPPIYDWKNGYLCGTHNWAERQWTGSIENGWREVFEIEPEIVYRASQYFASARDFLGRENLGKATETTD